MKVKQRRGPRIPSGVRRRPGRGQETRGRPLGERLARTPYAESRQLASARVHAATELLPNQCHFSASPVIVCPHRGTMEIRAI